MPVRNRDEYNAYMREYMLRRYHARRAESYEILGGVCVACGTNENLQIDHIDPALKTTEISKLWSIAKVRYLKELELCQLLCKPHHIEKTSGEATERARRRRESRNGSLV